MAVFPENMDKLDVQDPAQSLSIVEKYIGYMSERIEFAIRNVTKNVNAAGISSAELYILVQAQAHIVADLQSEVTNLKNRMTTAESNITAINNRLGIYITSVIRNFFITGTTHFCCELLCIKYCVMLKLGIGTCKSLKILLLPFL